MEEKQRIEDWKRGDVYQLGLASGLQLFYLKCGRGGFGEIGITHRRFVVVKGRGKEGLERRGGTYCVNRAFFFFSRRGNRQLCRSLAGQTVGGLYMFSASWGGHLKNHKEKLTQLSTSKKNTGRESGALLLAIFSLLVV